MTQRVRPTLRCLREDLGQAIPHSDTPLDEVKHPLLAKASERFAGDSTPQERIASIDDQVLFKVKVQRWRGAVWVADDTIPWLVAAGQREDGSPDDFWKAEHAVRIERRQRETVTPCYASRSWTAESTPPCWTVPLSAFRSWPRRATPPT